MKKKILSAERQKIPYMIFAVLITIMVCAPMQAQEKVSKLNETFNTNEAVTVNVNAKRTQLIVETWNKNAVEVEAYLTSEDFTKEELQEIAKTWNLEVLGNSNRISISSTGNIPGAIPGGARLSPPIAGMTVDFIQPLMVNMVGPMLEGMANTNLPPQFYEGMSSLKFDYEAYQKEGENYVKQYEKEVEKRFGKDFDKAMEEWGKNFEKKAEAWSTQLEERMQAFEGEHGASIEAWGENFGKQMEAWGEQFGAHMEQMANEAEKNGGNYSKIVQTTPNGGKSIQISYSNSSSSSGKNPSNESVKRVVVVKMPKNAPLILNLRHGSVTLEDDVNNLKGDIAHASFTAKTISGKETALSVAYSPIEIDNWEYGNINMSYVKNGLIKQAKSIHLSSNASDVEIGNLLETGVISGSFGELTIAKIESGFKNLSINLENSDLLLHLPETAFHINYSGSRSNIDYPKNLEAKVTENYGNQFINGYRKSRDTERNININARFSDVALK